MKKTRFVFCVFLYSSSINATTLMLPTEDRFETHFNTPCYNYNGYWLPTSRADLCNRDLFWSSTRLNLKVEPKDEIMSICKDNDVDKLLHFYNKWQSDKKRSELLKFIIFPDRILDKTTYASCVEENNATKLAILLSAALGNIEAQVLALDILRALTSGDAVAQKLEALKLSLHPRLTRINPTHINAANLLGLSTLPSLELPEEEVAENIKLLNEHKAQMEQNSNARTLLRIADKYLLTNRHDEASLYLQSAANKGSIRALLTMVSLIANRSKNPERRFVDIESLLGKYQGLLGGYEYLLPAYYYQYGSLGLVQRNLSLANQHYKMAISKNCREAAFEYGEFLMSMLNTCRADDARRAEFYKHAILAYEKSGDLGLELGYSKALELLSNQDIFDQTLQKSISSKLLGSKIFFQPFDMISENHISKDESPAKKRVREETVDRETFMSDLMLKIVDISKI